ncbi:MAG: hypothetical protein RLZZ450_5477, partial [Pseudomonadota bacterium]
MSTRLLAPPLLSSVVAVLIGSLFCLVPVGCTWEPIARTVQPERLLEGPARVVAMVEGDDRHAIVELGVGSDMRRHLVNVEDQSNCVLPAGARQVGRPLR